MDLLKILKQFKNIEPNRAFSETSRRAVLAQAEAMPAWSVKRALFGILEAGTAVALAGFFIMLITGGFSGSRLAPVQYSAIDPQGLRAEAQAIDIQIQLANLNYQGSTAESTVQTVKPANTTKAASPVTSATSTPAATPTLTIDQALEKLSN